MKKILLAFVLVSFFGQAQAQDEFTIGETTVVVEDLITGIDVPWEILWGPDDHIWVTEKTGRVLRIDPQTGISTTILDITSAVLTAGEPGLLGMTLHPDFENEPFVYLAYTTGASVWNGEERLSRFTWDGSSLSNEEVLLDDIQAGGIHNGSRLIITPDNKILMSTGDVGEGSLSQNMMSNNGKMLRINLDGSIPADNPNPLSYIYSFGHRNSQGLCVGPTGIIYSSEHGANSSDEFNIIEANRDYGWPNVQGACNTTGEMSYCSENDVREPLTEWSPCIAVNGIEYYNHEAIPEWENSVLMAVLGGLNAQYERLTVLSLSDDGQSVDGEESYFQNYNQRMRDVCVDPNTGSVYIAFNGVSYPSSGPNRIVRVANPDFVESVGEEMALQAVNIYPNPAQNQVNIEVDASFVNTTFKVYHTAGGLMQEGTIQQGVTTLDISKLTSGSYFVIIEKDGTVLTRSFLKK